jgi:hypothetical protein
MTMEHKLVTERDADSLATRAAGFAADRARAAVAGHGTADHTGDVTGGCRRKHGRQRQTVPGH